MMSHTMPCGCEVVDMDWPSEPPDYGVEYCPQHAAAPVLFEACSFPGDYGVLLNLAADIIDDVGHGRQQGIARKLREKAKLECGALELATEAAP